MNSRRRAGRPHLGRHRWLGRSTFAWQHLDDIRVDQNIIAAREDRLPNRWPISHLNQATPHRDMTRVVDLYGAARPGFNRHVCESYFRRVRNHERWLGSVVGIDDGLNPSSRSATVNRDRNSRIDHHAFIVDSRQDAHLAATSWKRVDCILNLEEVSETMRTIADGV